MVLHILGLVQRHAVEVDALIILHVAAQQVIGGDQQIGQRPVARRIHAILRQRRGRALPAVVRRIAERSGRGSRDERGVAIVRAVVPLQDGACRLRPANPSQQRPALRLAARRHSHAQLRGEPPAFGLPVVHQRRGAHDQVRSHRARLVAPRHQQRQQLHGFAQSHLVGQDAAESLVAHRVQPAEPLDLVRPKHRGEPRRHRIRLRVHDAQPVHIGAERLVLRLVVHLAVQIVGAGRRQSDGPLFQVAHRQIQIGKRLLGLVRIHGGQVQERAVTQPMEPLAPPVAGQQVRHIIRVNLVGDRRDLHQPRPDRQPQPDRRARRGEQSVERGRGEHLAQAAHHRQALGEQPPDRVVVRLLDERQRPVRTREIVQHGLHGQPFGVAVAPGRILADALERVIPPVAVPRPDVAGHASLVAVQIDLDHAGFSPQPQHLLRQPDRNAGNTGARRARLRIRLAAVPAIRRHRREQRRHRAHEQVGIARRHHHVLAAFGAAQHVDGPTGPHERLRTAVDQHPVVPGRRIRKPHAPRQTLGQRRRDRHERRGRAFHDVQHVQPMPHHVPFGIIAPDQRQTQVGVPVHHVDRFGPHPVGALVIQEGVGVHERRQQLGGFVTGQQHGIRLGAATVVWRAAGHRLADAHGPLQHVEYDPRALAQGVAGVHEREFAAVGSELLMPHRVDERGNVLDHVCRRPAGDRQTEPYRPRRAEPAEFRPQDDAADRQVPGCDAALLHAGGAAE